MREYEKITEKIKKMFFNVEIQKCGISNKEVTSKFWLKLNEPGISKYTYFVEQCGNEWSITLTRDIRMKAHGFNSGSVKSQNGQTDNTGTLCIKHIQTEKEMLSELESLVHNARKTAQMQLFTDSKIVLSKHLMEIDGLNNRYEGYVNTKFSLRGYAPWFTLEVAKQVLEDSCKEDAKHSYRTEWRYDKKHDCIVFNDLEQDIQYNFYGMDRKTELGIIHLYRVDEDWMWDIEE